MLGSDHVVSAQAVYDASVSRYVEFAGSEVSAATEGPLDRSVLAAFVEMVRARRRAPVADLGCGPGRVAAYLAAHDLEVIGVDVSLPMLAHARGAHPTIRFEQGRLDDLPVPDASLAAVVCWYSVIYTPPERLGEIFAELLRVLRSDGLLLLAFQAGHGQAVHHPDAHGTGLPLTSYRHSLDAVAGRMKAAGLEVHATAQRQPELAHESDPQAFVIAVGPPAGSTTSTR